MTMLRWVCSTQASPDWQHRGSVVETASILTQARGLEQPQQARWALDLMDRHGTRPRPGLFEDREDEAEVDEEEAPGRAYGSRRTPLLDSQGIFESESCSVERDPKDRWGLIKTGHAGDWRSE